MAEGGVEQGLVLPREFVMVENKRLVCLPDLTADFGVTTIRKVTHQISAEIKSKT